MALSTAATACGATAKDDYFTQIKNLASEIHFAIMLRNAIHNKSL
jgi:hypothetical protein